MMTMESAPPLPGPLPDRILLPWPVDAARLQADFARVAGSDWIAHLVPDNYEGDWSVLPLRHKRGAAHPILKIYSDPSATEFEDGPLLEAMPYVRGWLSKLACPVQAVRLMRLAPGSRIKPHQDHDLAAEMGAVRLHVPITTNDGVVFTLNDRPVRMLPGSVWYLRLSDTHAVVNAGDGDRVHLVIDCVADDWLMAALRTSAALMARETAPPSHR